MIVRRERDCDGFGYESEISLCVKEGQSYLPFYFPPCPPSYATNVIPIPTKSRAKIVGKTEVKSAPRPAAAVDEVAALDEVRAEVPADEPAAALPPVGAAEEAGLAVVVAALLAGVTTAPRAVPTAGWKKVEAAVVICV